MHDISNHASPSIGQRPTRIFWLGMHKILVQTEFKLLQQIGYEVFRPPYLSDVVDQSTSSSTDFGNAQLPPEVADKLSGYNFFYNSISPEIADLLNAYFDAMVVTINPDWLKAALQAFDGTMIYRCYGQLGTVSESLVYNGCRQLIDARAGFHFLPHAPECLDDEEDWLIDLATVVPYWLTPDVFEVSGSWEREAGARSKSIAITCPNIANPYYEAHFRYLKRFFEERCFRYYGVQVVPNADLNVVGTLPRALQLTRLARESAYLYTYRERNVCYLPPIEMMVMGGPVLYFPGSLLARYFGDRTPGMVRDEAEAVVRAKRLMAGDAALTKEIVDSQALVAYRYRPEYGEVAFTSAIHRILPTASALEAAPATSRSARGVLLFAHLGGYVVRDGQFSSIHGIPRVMRKFVKALNETKTPVTVTHSGPDRELIQGFFAAECAHPELVSTVESTDIASRPQEVASRFEYAVVPHYHLFPEANALELPILAYIPDYLPHFFEGRGWFQEVSSDVDCGRRLAARARRVLTNSRFSQTYLPSSKLAVAAAKIAAFPLPFLGRTSANGNTARPQTVPEVVSSEAYIFYPTQPHPHKRLDILVMAWLLVNRQRTTQVRLVLTAGALPAKLCDLIAAAGLAEYCHLLPAIDDSAVEWLYSHARCLAFSSELEGNFPTQVLEALYLDCPVVCSDNPLITSELGDLVGYLQVAPFGDVEAFAHALAYCIDHRDHAIRRQSLAKQQIMDRFSYERFRRNVIDLHCQMTSKED